MASAQGTAPESELLGERRRPLTPARKPLYRDPLSVAGWFVAVAALVGYWYFFARRTPPRPGDEVARLTAVAGDVRLRPLAQEVWEEARGEERLRVGDLIQTEPRSAAEIAFDAGSVVNVRPNSVVHIGGSAESSTAAWRVQAGNINFSVGAETTEIVTPTARTTAESFSTGNIDVTEAGATGIKVFRGRARVETSRQRITLSENEAVQVDAAGRAGAKLALPPPPELLAPEPRAEIPSNTAARLSWTAVEGGASYRLAMDYNVQQANLLLAAALDAPGITDTVREIADLGPGRYFWRVAAVNAGGLEGAFSRTSLFAVVPPPPQTAPTPPPPPRLEIEALVEVAPGIFRLEGRTDPHATVTVNGATTHVLPDGSFTEYIQRGLARALVVRSTIRGGATSERSHAFAPR